MPATNALSKRPRLPLLVLAALVVTVANPGRAAERLGDLTGPWQLFVDDHLIAESDNLVRVYHAFEKHTGNPVMTADKPWEGNAVYIYGTVLPNEDGQGYRMWYHSYDGDYRMLYATSNDGIRWTKPNLGLTSFQGSTENNILFHLTHENHNPQVIHTPWTPTPSALQDGLLRIRPHTASARSPVSRAYSPDGIIGPNVRRIPCSSTALATSATSCGPPREAHLG